MHFQTLTTLLLPAMALAAPASLSARQDATCAPTSYTLSDFKYTTGPASSNPTVHFGLKPTYSNPSIITDAAAGGATCDSTGATLDSFPNETVCSTGRNSLMYGLRARVDQASFQIIHQWHCNGQQWMSSTPRKIVLACNPGSDGSTTCTSATQTFVPENVRRICSTPTCP